MAALNRCGGSTVKSPLKPRGGPHWTPLFDLIARDPSIRFFDKALLWVLKSHLNADGDCTPFIGQIADELGVKRTSVFEGLKRLEAKGIITRQHRSARGNMTSSFFLFADEHYARHCAKKVKKGSPPTRTPMSVRRRGHKVDRTIRENSPIIREDPAPFTVVRIAG